MLYSYVIKQPNYLETQEAVDILNKEKQELKAKKEENKSSDVQEKLVKLKELRDLNLISESDYEHKKAQLLENF